MARPAHPVRQRAARRPPAVRSGRTCGMLALTSTSLALDAEHEHRQALHHRPAGSRAAAGAARRRRRATGERSRAGDPSACNSALSCSAVGPSCATSLVSCDCRNAIASGPSTPDAAEIVEPRQHRSALQGARDPRAAPRRRQAGSVCRAVSVIGSRGRFSMPIIIGVVRRNVSWNGEIFAHTGADPCRSGGVRAGSLRRRFGARWYVNERPLPMRADRSSSACKPGASVRGDRAGGAGGRRRSQRTRLRCAGTRDRHGAGEPARGPLRDRARHHAGATARQAAGR